MKAGIKRIEATLHDLGTRDTTVTDAGENTKRPVSFRISVAAKEGTDSQTSEHIEELSIDSPSEITDTQNLFPHHSSVQTFPTQEDGGKTPNLPKFKTPSFSNHRHGANPALATNILQEIHEHVAGWQKELHTIVQQIQDIYLEGPIVNGWLESNPWDKEHGGTATLRHGEVERLIDYVEEICAPDGSKIPHQNLRTGYRLCGVDASGKVWSRPCPPNQLATVSMAIARYQKLRQLLGRKQYLETRLSQLAETLVVLHSHIQQV
ncbi:MULTISPECIES: hypothetical protein [unclassified Anabaena]|uniref:hypothetical protein n=1 Tax=unclassified Anabaena TaxID=2619674 RepID=UPI002B1EC5AA|nr:hypothetical protein [Anabaena sp. UHCC 0399]MEA5563936.1 hypothetical protein [Anabaena sp. UHCC 0399]